MHVFFWIWLFLLEVAIGELFGWVLYLIDGGRLLFSLFGGKSSNYDTFTEEDEDDTQFHIPDDKPESSDSLNDALNSINQFKEK